MVHNVPTAPPEPAEQDPLNRLNPLNLLNADVVGGVTTFVTPSFATLVLIPLTFSITQGILCGFILHALLYACVGRGREVPVALWLLALLSLGLLLIR